jgi:hypothetical protein
MLNYHRAILSSQRRDKKNSVTNGGHGMKKEVFSSPSRAHLAVQRFFQ